MSKIRSGEEKNLKCSNLKMALHVKQECYCCSRPSNKMDIDSALNELGMLSTITESRKQYLQERNRTRSESSLTSKEKLAPLSPNRYQIIHIDKKYVTGISDFGNSNTRYSTSPQKSFDVSRNSESNPPVADYGSCYSNVPNLPESESQRKLMSKIRHGKARRFRKPYAVPWRLYHSFQESDLHKLSETDCMQSKSNSTSPVKPMSDISLPRSRSFDNLNLDLVKLKLTDIFDKNSDKLEIDKMSQDMNHLHVSDS
ncbi:hypothetical protein CHS0354_020080 [Potamilus streckersoni]|uniref:Uncharacterized protein n=1 Tax=Potamilus streckersoni TaxID=2493646 RepID=A0AAE0SCJ5_9BIVA|nr:hypothetical protein CHS0354_020080 [Potamilus streckersoni]